MSTNKINYKLINKAEIARRLGISQTYVWMILNGQKTGKAADKWLKRIIAEASKTTN